MHNSVSVSVSALSVSVLLSSIKIRVESPQCEHTIEGRCNKINYYYTVKHENGLQLFELKLYLETNKSGSVIKINTCVYVERVDDKMTF